MATPNLFGHYLGGTASLRTLKTLKPLYIIYRYKIFIKKSKKKYREIFAEYKIVCIFAPAIENKTFVKCIGRGFREEIPKRAKQRD